MIDYLFRVAAFVEKTIGILDVTIEESNIFGYDYENAIIYITDERDDLDITWDTFMLNYLKEEFEMDLTGYRLEMFSLLHEIGHFKTIHLFDNEEYEKEVNKLPDDDFLAYRRLYGEYLADDWAVSFINKYPEILNIKY